jgi:hypothetical protein
MENNMSNDTAQTTEQTTEDTTTEATAVAELPILTTEQEIAALRSVHEFLSKFDRVPGFLANQWSQALDTVAVVANSLIRKATDANAQTTTEAQAEDTITQ